MNAAITGFGGVGEMYATIFEHCDDVELVAICDIDPDQLDDLDGVATYTNHREMVQSEDIDLSVIGTPPTVREELVRTSAENDCTVLVEKPTTSNLEDFDRLAQIDAEVDAPISAVQNLRFTPTVDAAIQSVEDGIVGDVTSVEVVWSESIDPKGADIGQESWADELSVGGISESMPHFVYLALGFVDDLSDFTVQWQKFGDGSEYPDGLAILGEDTAGRMVKIQWTSHCPRRRRRVRVYGSDGEMTVDIDNRALSVTKNGAEDTVRPIRHSDIPDPIRNRWSRGHYRMVRQWAESSQAGAPSAPVPLEQDRDVVRVLEEAGSQWTDN